MRIAIISTPFLPVPPRSYGGTELIVYELVEGLRERGHDVTLFATADSSVEANVRSLYRTAQWPPECLPDLNHVSWSLQEIVRSMPFDVVHAHSAVALACARFLPRLPLIYTLHHEREKQLSAFYRFFPSVQYIAISEDQRRREIALPHVHVIHHGLDPSRYEWVPRPSDYVCFLGRLALVKGPHTAIDVAARAGLPIQVAGEVHAPDRHWAEREMNPRLSLPHVRYLGSIGPSLKVPLLRDARALVAPIEWNEPFGLVFIEAMLSGCPVVAFRRGSVPEVVENGVTGFVVDSADQMVQVLRPGGVLDGFNRQRCRERASLRFGRDRLAIEHARLYERVAARHRRRAARQELSGAH
jgi:glycosyltransferase involved in cell wall biosynthesis